MSEYQSARQFAARHAGALAGDGADGLCAFAEEHWADDCVWAVSHPINECTGRTGVLDNVWLPLVAAFPDIERRNFISVAGSYQRKTFVGSTGHLWGTFRAPWLGIPPNGQATPIRFAEFIEVGGDPLRVQRGHLLFDLIELARQAGVPLLPDSMRASGNFPAPATADGLRLKDSPAEESAASLALVERMMSGLMSYDKASLESMGQSEYWHKNFLWYGPEGIGTARGLSGFQTVHQQPFLRFIPDRIGGDHFARFGDGSYIASGGWPSIRATTSGAPWVGVDIPPDIKITMRVMDFWRRDENWLRENWVFIDIPDVMRQCGIDLFAALKRSGH